MATLELNEDRGFQERFWALQRGAWAAFATLILIALLGFTGRGGAFARDIAASGGNSVDYPSLSRFAAEDEFIVRIAPETGFAEVAFDRKFHELFRIKSIDPAPVRAIGTASGTRYRFELAPRETAEIRVLAEARRPAIGATTRLELDGHFVLLRPLILP